MTAIIGAGGGGCFTGGTYVRTPDGACLIERLQEGDKVVSFDDKGILHEATILKVHKHEEEQVYKYNFWGGASFTATSNHWVLNQFNAFVAISNLGPDDCVVDVNNHLLPIVGQEDKGVATVYNLTVEGQHTFIADNIRVHNAGLGQGTGGTRKIIGAGGGGGKGGGRTPTTAPDSLDSKSYANVLDLISEGECEGLKDGLKSIYFDNTPLENTDGSSNFDDVTVDTRTGTSSQTKIPGFNKASSTTSVNAQVTKTTPVTRTVTTSDQVDAVRVIIRIPQLQKIEDDGDIIGRSVRIKINLIIDGGSPDLKIDDTIEGRTGDLYKRDYRVDLPDSFTSAAIQIVRQTDDSSDPTRLSNETWWDSFVTITEGDFSYPNSALCGIRINAEQFQSIPRRAYLFRGVKVRIPSNATVDSTTGALIYSGVWNGQFSAATWCADPAWCLWDLLTSRRYGLGDHLLTPDEQIAFNGNASRLDKWAFYSASQYSTGLNTHTTAEEISERDDRGLDERTGTTDDFHPTTGRHGVYDGFGKYEPRFSCNINIQGRGEAFTLINSMASVFRGMPYWSTGSLTIGQDKLQTSSFLFTLANVSEAGFTYSGSSQKTRTTVAVIKYFDNELRSYAYEEVKDNDAIARYGVITKNLEAFACTSRGQAHRVGKWLLYSEGNETETVTFTTSLEAGVICRPGQIIDISDPVKAGERRGGRIKSVSSASTIVVDSTNNLPPNSVSATRTLHVISPTGIVESREISSISGASVTTQTDFDVEPQANGVWIIETSGGTSAENLQTSQWRVISVTEEEGIEYQVTALSYNSSKYGFVEAGIALTQRDFTNLNELPATPGRSLTGTYSRSGTTITVSITGHGFTSDDVGRFVCLDFNGGVAIDSGYAIASVPDANSLTLTDTNGSGTTSGSVTLTTLRAFQQLYTKGNEIKVKIIFSWESILGVNEYEVRWRKDGGNWNVHRQQAPDDEIRDVTSGTYEFKIFSLNAARVPSTDSLNGKVHCVGKTRPPSRVSNFASEISPHLGLLLTWDKLVGVYPHFDDLDVVSYEIRTTDTDWGLTNNDTVAAGGNLVARVSANSYKIGTIPPGTQAYHIKAIDSEDNYSTLSRSISVTIGLPNKPEFNDADTGIEGDIAVLVWPAVSVANKYAIDHYEIFKGGTTSAHSLGTTDTTRFTTPVIWGGTETFHIRAVDIAGNASDTPMDSVDVVNSPAPAPSPNATYVDDTLVLNWSEVHGSIPTRAYEIRQGNTFSGASVKGRVKATEFTLAVDWSSNQKFWVVAVNTVRISGTDTDLFGTEGDVDVVFNLPGTPTLADAFIGENVRVTWNAVTGSLPVSEYEIKLGTTSQTFADANELPGNSIRQDGTAYSQKVEWGGIDESGTSRPGTKRLWVRGIDARGNAGTAANVDISVTIPKAPDSYTQEVIDNNVLLRWTDATTSLPIVYYSLKKGSSLSTPALFVAGGTDIGAKQGKFTTVFETTSGTFTYWIAGVDSAGNVGTPESVTASVNQPPDYVLRSDINSTFATQSDGPGGASDTLVIRTGATYARSGTTITVTSNNHGFSNGDLVFLDFTSGAAVNDVYTVAGSATNTFTVTSSASGTTSGNVNIDPKAHVVSEGGKLFANLNTTQTWEEHFDDMSWTTLQDQETQDSGKYNMYGLPSETSGGYIEEVDYGAVLAGTRVIIALDAIHAAGTTSITPSIFTKREHSDAWTEFPGAATNSASLTYSTFATQFRFVKYKLAFSSAGNDDLLRINALNLRLETKQISDTGRGLVRAERSATYTKTGTTITISQTGHGYSAGAVISLDFTSGSHTQDGIYKIATVGNANEFTVTEFLADTSGAPGSANVWTTVTSGTQSSAANVTLDKNGCAIVFNSTFVDIESITATPRVVGGSGARIAIYDFVDTPNPKAFKVLLFNTDGDRVGDTSGHNFSWQVRGS